MKDIFIAILLLAELAPGQSSSYLKKGQLSPYHRDVLSALGDRLETPGKERLVLNGVLMRFAGKTASTSTISVISEYPGNLRVDDPQGAGKTVILNSGGLWQSSGQTGKDDSDLADSFGNDTVDHFLQGRTAGFAIRTLGKGFRMKDVLNPSEMLTCDAYQVAENGRRKNYCFELSSHLLLSVAYETGSAPVAKVETRFADWHLVQGQMIPGRIARFESGSQVLLFTVNSAAVGTKAQDAAFTHP